MARRIVELTGQKFGRWVVLEKCVERTKFGEVLWQCICECGNQSKVKGSNLLSGGSVSCGCYQIECVSSHQMTGLPTFKSWESMKQRCTNTKSPDYPNYGERGIAVCDRWLNSFDNFLADMGVRPTNCTIERKDVNQGYSPENCKWATRSEQQRNKRTTPMIEWNGESKSAAEWSEITNIPARIISDRIRVGWPANKALTQPNRKAKK